MANHENENAACPNEDLVSAGDAHCETVPEPKPEPKPELKPVRPKKKKPFIFIGLIAALAIIAGICLPSRFWARVRVTTGFAFSDTTDLSGDLKASELELSLKLGRDYFLANQQQEGNFVYEYDWKADRILPGDGDVRQAGALWGLSLLWGHFGTQGEGDPALRQALERGFRFWEARSHMRPDGAKYVAYPNSSQGSTGTIALLALAHIDFLRAAPASDPLRARCEEALSGYLRFLATARAEDGRWHARYSLSDGQPMGAPSPYFDGESLLALVKAAKYLDYKDYWPIVESAAEQGYQLNVAAALKEHPNSDTTKGYYQWSSMAFYEIATANREVSSAYVNRVLELARWMVHTHHTLFCTRNTAYAYEGLIHAYELARTHNEPRLANELRSVIDIGMGQLTGWQLGHPRADGWAFWFASMPERARGGIQNSWINPALRIDVVQHQMHAVLLALRYVYRG